MREFVIGSTAAFFLLFSYAVIAKTDEQLYNEAIAMLEHPESSAKDWLIAYGQVMFIEGKYIPPKEDTFIDERQAKVYRKFLASQAKRAQIDKNMDELLTERGLCLAAVMMASGKSKSEVEVKQTDRGISLFFNDDEIGFVSVLCQVDGKNEAIYWIDMHNNLVKPNVSTAFVIEDDHIKLIMREGKTIVGTRQFYRL